jgi:hypothetical protein
MKTKRLWIWAFILGLIATASIYFIITANNNAAAPAAAPTILIQLIKMECYQLVKVKELCP